MKHYETIPKKVQVGYRTMKVRVFPDIESKNQMYPLAGLCNTMDGVISLSPDMPAQELGNTLLHEVLHAVWHVVGLPHDEKEEDHVNRLANGLAQVIRDNQKMIEFLLQVSK